MKRSTTDDYHKLDIRYLARSRLLEPGTIATVRWSSGGHHTGGIGIRVLVDGVELDYRIRSVGGQWERKLHLVNFTTTECSLGGARKWFECPTPSCKRRVAILYGGEIFVCRHCRRLTYPSQCLPAWERAILKAERVRDRLNWQPGIFNGLGWNKPKGMHWKTFSRLVHKYAVLADEGLSGLSERV